MAQWLDVSHSYICNLRKGRVRVGWKILTSMGVETVYRIKKRP
jgi:expansin (peptidoglycan-binding protein)